MLSERKPRSILKPSLIFEGKIEARDSSKSFCIKLNWKGFSQEQILQFDFPLSLRRIKTFCDDDTCPVNDDFEKSEFFSNPSSEVSPSAIFRA